MSRAYYNEFDAGAAAWLREMIADGLIPPGVVDERSIGQVTPSDLEGFDQCHFFAGIGGWPSALRLAGWPDDRPVWTGSCPCQPFSDAGKGEGFDDARHLWPTWFRLIRECRPPVVFGEQVASKAGLGWLDLVSTDLEAADYAFGAADLAAAGVGAPHRRQRLFFVADSERSGSGAGRAAGAGRGPSVELDRFGAARALANTDVRRRELAGYEVDRAEAGAEVPADQRERLWLDARDGGVAVGMADAGRHDHRGEDERHEVLGAQAVGPTGWPSDDGATLGLAHGDGQRLAGRPESHERQEQSAEPAPRRLDAGGRGPWSDLAWIDCRDGKLRPTKPGLFPLAHGVPGRVGLLRGAGNAIVPQIAEAFIRAYCEARGIA